MCKRSRSGYGPLLAALAAVSLSGCGAHPMQLQVPFDGASGSQRSDAGGAAGGPASTGASDATDGTAPADFGPFTVNADGYVTVGPWQGHAWTATDSTISPASFTGMPAGAPLCARGTVGRYSGSFAILGFNLAEPLGGAIAGWTPTGPGLAYDIANAAGSPLRMQMDGSGRQGGKWCTVIRSDRGQLDWGQFNSRCWDGSGDVYDGRVPLTNVMVLVPGSDTEDVVFDFCVSSIAPRM